MRLDNLSPQNNSRGKLLKSESGRHNLSAIMYRAFCALLYGTILGCGLFVISRTTDAIPRAIALCIVFISIVLIIMSVMLLIQSWKRFQSEIHVYETCIVGKSVRGFFPTLQAFSVPISDIGTVDLIKKVDFVCLRGFLRQTKTPAKDTGIILRTPYATYTSYTKNAGEIRDVILSLIF